MKNISIRILFLFITALTLNMPGIILGMGEQDEISLQRNLAAITASSSSSSASSDHRDDNDKTLLEVLSRRFPRCTREEVETCLEKAPKGTTSTRDPNGFHHIHWAIRRGAAPDAIEAILDHDPDSLQATSHNGETPLHSAVQYSNPIFIKLLLARNPHINARDSDGRTALHFAARMAHEDVILELMKRGADKTITDNFGRTALHYAKPKNVHVLKTAKSTRYFEALVRNLEHQSAAEYRDHVKRSLRTSNNSLKHGPPRLPHNIYRSPSPLYKAAVEGDCTTAQQLLNDGADPNLLDRADNTALHCAASQNNMELIRLLLDHGADAAHCNVLGFPAYWYAQPEVRKFLETLSDRNLRLKQIREYMPPLSRNKNGEEGEEEETELSSLDRALQKAMDYEDHDAAFKAISSGANPRTRDSLERTLLHHAQSSDEVTNLVRAGVSMDSQDKYGHPPLHYAIANKDDNVLEALLQSGGVEQANETLRVAMLLRDDKLVDRALAHKANLETKSYNQYTLLLQVVSKRGTTETADKLLKRGANPNTRSGPLLETPLHLAIMAHDYILALLLITYDADLTIKDDRGKTPMDYFPPGKDKEVFIKNAQKIQRRNTSEKEKI